MVAYRPSTLYDANLGVQGLRLPAKLHYLFSLQTNASLLAPNPSSITFHAMIASATASKA